MGSEHARLWTGEHLSIVLIAVQARQSTRLQSSG